ncbi:MAG: type II toxin-antitoxin system VapC family toxin [Sulfuricella sp.]|nr:type II toxin-antitoxin system VapC family toxin [Sulfuricella sp.]
MKLLLDTHLAIWWEANHPRLPRIVKELVCDQAESVFLSRASLWEIAIKISTGKLRMDVGQFVGNIESNGFEWLDIKNEHLLAVSTLPLHDDHRDPFDRLLVAQSRSEPLVLLTVDAKLARYGETVKVV